jgi:L-serine dehydratase
VERINAIVSEQGLVAGELTIGDCIVVAEKAQVHVSEVIIAESMTENNQSQNEIENAVISAFNHNFKALEAGIGGASSFLFGHVAQELGAEGVPPVVEDRLLNKMIIYTLAAQVGNHGIGLQPCAGTGDSCPYAGFMKAVSEAYDDHGLIVRAAALILKVGTIFRAGKTSTGCNMEGFGAGSAATAAAFAELNGGSPDQVGKAIVLALSPTIGNPCTPRVMVPGLCATHIGGAIMNGKLASHLAVFTRIPINVPVDVMIAMAASVHQVSAKTIVPEVINYMEPFFRTNHQVEAYISDAIKVEDQTRKQEVHHGALKEARELARKANSIVKPFGTAVVGGSSQAVGSPTNTGRLAHFLAKGKISKVIIDLYPELFARRGINIPGVLMGAVYGAATDNGKLYREVMDQVKSEGIDIVINQVDSYQTQRVTIEASERGSMVNALNRGGGRLALVAAIPSKTEALTQAKRLEIEIVD